MDSVQSPVRRTAAARGNHAAAEKSSPSAAAAQRPRRAPKRCQLVWGTATFRFTMLILSMFAVSSGYFSYDLPSITSSELKSAGIVRSNQELGMLFSVYAAPNAIAPLLSGFWFAHIGVWRGVLSIASVITCGICVVALGVWMGSYPLLLAGRALYGLAGESLFVGIDVLITGWFREAELGLSYGLIQAAGQGGSFAAFYAAPWLTKLWGGTRPVYILAACISALATGCLLAALLLEKQSLKPHDVDDESVLENDVDDEDETRMSSSERSGLLGGHEASADGNADTDADADANAGDASQLLEDAAPKLLKRVHQHPEPSNPRNVTFGGVSISDASSDAGSVATATTGTTTSASASWRYVSQSALGRLVGLDHLAALEKEFWMVFVGIVSYSTCFYCLLAFANDWLQSEFGMNPSQSGRMAGVISILSCVISPTSGLIMDKYGYRPIAALVAMATACISFAMMGFAPVPISLCLALGGTAYSVLPSALYPMIAETVSEESFTVVYAMTAGAVNMLLTIAFYAAGWMSEHDVSEADLASVDAAEAGAATATATFHAADEDSGGSGGQANYALVFVMFVAVSGVGTVAMAMLVYDRWRRKALQWYDVTEEVDLAPETDGDGEGQAAVEAQEEEADAERGRAAPMPTARGRSSPTEPRDRFEGRSIDSELQALRRELNLAPVLISPPSVAVAVATAPVAQQQQQQQRRPPLAAARQRTAATAVDAALQSGVQHYARSRPVPIPTATSGAASRTRSAAPTSPRSQLRTQATSAGAAATEHEGTSRHRRRSAAPLLLADGHLYRTGLRSADRVEHTLPMQIMDARMRHGGFAKPIVAYRAPTTAVPAQLAASMPHAATAVQIAAVLARNPSSHAEVERDAAEFWHTAPRPGTSAPASSAPAAANHRGLHVHTDDSTVVPVYAALASRSPRVNTANSSSGAKPVELLSTVDLTALSPRSRAILVGREA
jgi:MFS family permease